MFLLHCIYINMSCWERGKAAEQLFAAIAIEKGYTVIKATPLQDRLEHKDMMITKNNVSAWVDVKAQKRLSRTDETAQDDRILLELHGRGVKNKGWLYGGQARFIAQETVDGFLFLSRTALIRYVERYVGATTHATSSKEAYYKVYNRSGADLFTWVDRTHLCQHALRCHWRKPLPVIGQVVIQITDPKQWAAVQRALQQTEGKDQKVLQTRESDQQPENLQSEKHSNAVRLTKLAQVPFSDATKDHVKSCRPANLVRTGSPKKGITPLQDSLASRIVILAGSKQRGIRIRDQLP